MPTLSRLPLALLLASCAVEDPTSSTELAVSAIDRTPNHSGFAESVSTIGSVRSDLLFQVASNGRSCATCHDPAAGWTIRVPLSERLGEPPSVDGPLFKPFDASRNPAADHSTLAARQSLYSLVTSRGLLRTTEPMQPPPAPDFAVVSVADPHKFSTPTAFTRFRRPTSIANVALAQTMLWNGAPLDRRALLEMISHNAAAFHLQAPLTTTAARKVADEMDALFHAQGEDRVAGRLDADGARGGVIALTTETFVPGHDDPLQPGFDPNVFQLYGAWEALPPTTARNIRRASIARGEIIFNNRRITISGVAGLNDATRPTITGACSTCHNARNVGGHSVFRPMNIGTASPALAGATELPHLVVERTSTGERATVTDLGVANDTGKWDDLGKFSVPRLRGLASRAPYFHAGSHKSLADVVGFYNARFSIGLTATEKEDLAAFLAAL